MSPQSATLAMPGYEFLELIGEGGLSSVYRGRHQETGQIVALKVVKDQGPTNHELITRFEHEFRAATRLLHPNIVQALDFHRDESIACLVLEFVDGPTLSDRIQREGPLVENAAVFIIAQVAQALHYAHLHKIIHRDIKPQNILIKPNGQAKLADFGLVKDVLGGLRLTGPLSVLGTPHFMAPEQYEDARKVDARSDVYSLAATLYCAVTGKLPFAAESPRETIQKQAANDLVPPRSLVPDLSERLERVILDAMSPDPEKRPASALDFVKLLRPRSDRREVVAGEPDADDGARALERRMAERRSAVRHPFILGTVCAVKNSLHETGEKIDSWPATVLDVSTHGMALSLIRRFEPGTILTVELSNALADQTRRVEARVVYVKPQGFGHWQAGCAFEQPLAEEELRSLL